MISNSRLVQIANESRASEHILTSAPEEVQRRNKELGEMAAELLKRRRFCHGFEDKSK